MLVIMVYNFFDKKTGLETTAIEDLAQECHNPMTEKLKRTKVCARFKDNILCIIFS